MDERSAFICLNLIPGIGPRKVQKLIEYFGSASAIFKQRIAILKSVEGIGYKLAEQLSKGPQQYNPQDEERLADQAGVILLSRECPQYPRLLLEIVDPPLVLYVKGQLDVLQQGNSSLAVVGSRRPTRYGLTQAQALSTNAVAAGWTIISGLAIGIDAAAHQATVQAGGQTIAVLGSGLARLYPQDNIELARSICEKGAVISEFPMTYPPDRRSFPMRNRIISGMSSGTIVVEAGLKSGTLITANQALEQGRAVFAMPGPVDRPHSRGCHSLIRQGAVLIESIADVMEELNSTSLFDLRVPVMNQAGIDKKEQSLVKCDLKLTETQVSFPQFPLISNHN